MVKSTLDEVAHAIASAPRRRIVGRLAEGPAAMGELATILDVTLPAIDKHVRVLEAAGLVRRRRDGRRSMVDLEPGGLALLSEWATGIRALWRARLTDFAEHIEGRQAPGKEQER